MVQAELDQVIQKYYSQQSNNITKKTLGGVNESPKSYKSYFTSHYYLTSPFIKEHNFSVYQVF